MLKSKTFLEVDKILWEHWDPIGVNDEPQARDEYTSYVAEILSLVASGVSVNALESHLKKIEAEEMHVSGHSEKRRATAQMLKNLSRRPDS